MTTTPDQPRHDPTAAPRPTTVMPKSPASPVSAPVNQPDVLRPSCANDPRNRNKIDPLHLSAGTDESTPPP